MLSFRTHLTVLDEAAALYPNAIAFRIPQLHPHSSGIEEWRSITYKEFHHDVEHFARYWSQKLSVDNIHPRSVIGVWLSGLTYVDALHIYGIARAGYIPQLISLRLPSPEVIFELLGLSKGKAVIFDASYDSEALRRAPLPMHIAVDARELDVADSPLPPTLREADPSEPIMIFHTSGSTSGRPKLVPCSYAWWAATIAKAQQIMRPKFPHRERHDATVMMGSLCHMGQSFMLVGALQHGSCMVQFTKQAFSSDELLDMIDRCGLTRMNIFPTFLATHLRNSRRDPHLLARLQGLDEILVSGLSMSPEDQAWVISNGIKVLDCYASTEVAVMMLSVDGEGNGRLPPLRPIDGVSYSLEPIAPSSPQPQSESGYSNIHARLLELVVRGDSPDCPDISLRSADGHFHTGDLFLEVTPGRYIFCGRDDDWVKSENSLRCNTKAIEDNVNATCGGLVSNCVVVGNGRPCPALFVESSVQMDERKLRNEIMRKIRPFHARRYMHERIASIANICVVPKDTLPRTATKGNIRRRAVEQQFKAELDRMYADSH
ncbi:acetyl-CoA synthetase-like protein [Wolfiporia cocos MD-104 SS10]|uniref:Acetyl-CoA synthetase-like protein n=1 Tax=Wolfiporia cocos (strain MD-104) TaxID=742152 RepID=A0A2H3J861_WOLCO|nr:acetyl-CoA synthetase-like protein [Wolfiporia cocos MD-104 SS10]